MRDRRQRRRLLIWRERGGGRRRQRAGGTSRGEDGGTEGDDDENGGGAADGGDGPSTRSSVFRGNDVAEGLPVASLRGGPEEAEYSWIADQQDAHEKSIFRRTGRVTAISIPPLESSQRGESRAVGSIFV